MPARSCNLPPHHEMLKLEGLTVDSAPYLAANIWTASKEEPDIMLPRGWPVSCEARGRFPATSSGLGEHDLREIVDD